MTAPLHWQHAPWGAQEEPEPPPGGHDVVPTQLAVPTPITHARTAPAYLVSVMTGQQRLVYAVLILAWLAANACFWTWWFAEEHITTPARMILNTVLVGYDILVPAWFLFFLGRMREPNPAIPPPPGLRVAMVTTMVPGAEPWPIVEATLRAMLDQAGYPHDVWLLDEGADRTVRERCAALGVRYFSRRFHPRYQQTVWPFKVKTKAGNYNAWLDAIGYERYDVLVQMDTDHVPQPGYLVEMLRPFANPAVQYVAAPSICDKNAEESWAAKARVEAEATLHGAIQAGYASFACPMIIGSHATFRTAALKRIGGFQRTLAEDHDNARVFAASGVKGAFAFQAIARGDGPATFADAMVQEYQWARALVQILLNYYPGQATKLRPSAFGIFTFAEVWYPLVSGMMFIGHLMPFAALLLGINWVSVYLPEFMLRHGVIGLVMLATIIWANTQGWGRPRRTRFLTWRMMLFQLARWPWMLMACLEAFGGWLLRKDFNFRVTPKGDSVVRPLPLPFLLPYAVILVASFATAAWWTGPYEVAGYMFFVIQFAALYSVLVLAVVMLHLRETGHAVANSSRFRPQLAMVTAGLVTAVLVIGLRGPDTVKAIALGANTGLDYAESLPPVVSEALPAAPRSTLSAPRTAPRPRRAPSTVDLFQGDRVLLGTFDPSEKLAAAPEFALELDYVPMLPNDAGDFVRVVERSQGLGRVPIVSLEPWPFTWVKGYTEANLLKDIAAGRYDGSLRHIARAARENGDLIYVRFAHEMELCGLFPWGTCQPDEYIAAYRHVVTTLRAEGASNLRFIWSPAGEETAAAYWPGGEYVDDIGITVLISDQWADWARTRPQPFAEAMSVYRQRFGRFGKPLILAEFGVALTDPNDKVRYLRQTVESLQDATILRGLVYFNELQPERSHGVTRPDWALTKDTARDFLDAYAEWERNLNPR